MGNTRSSTLELFFVCRFEEISNDLDLQAVRSSVMISLHNNQQPSKHFFDLFKRTYDQEADHYLELLFQDKSFQIKLYPYCLDNVVRFLGLCRIVRYSDKHCQLFYSAYNYLDNPSIFVTFYDHSPVQEMKSLYENCRAKFLRRDPLRDFYNCPTAWRIPIDVIEFNYQIYSKSKLIDFCYNRINHPHSYHIFAEEDILDYCQWLKRIGKFDILKINPCYYRYIDNAFDDFLNLDPDQIIANCPEVEKVIDEIFEHYPTTKVFKLLNKLSLRSRQYHNTEADWFIFSDSCYEFNYPAGQLLVKIAILMYKNPTYCPWSVRKLKSIHYQINQIWDQIMDIFILNGYSKQFSLSLQRYQRRCLRNEYLDNTLFDQQDCNDNLINVVFSVVNLNTELLL